VEVRRAKSWAATYLVPADAAQRVIADSELTVARTFPGRTMLTLTFVRYDDTDLDAYHEVGVVFLVQGPAGRGVYIRHLPVDQDFTLAAGRQLWGFPKTLADITIEETEREARCTLRQDGAEVLELRIRRGLVPVPQPTIPTYTNLDGRMRKTTWRVECSPRGRPGGATLHLGRHPIADELRAVGLPKRAMFTSVSPDFRASFDTAEIIVPPDFA